jgi:hypothetical protein
VPQPNGGLRVAEPVRDFPHAHAVPEPLHIESMGSWFAASRNRLALPYTWN